MKFVKYLETISEIDSIDESINFINKNILDIQLSYYSSSYLELQKSSLQVIEIFFDLVEKNLFQNNCQIVIAFIELLADFFERYKCVSPLVIINRLIDESTPLKKRIKAALLFHRVNDATVDYFNRFDKILKNLEDAQTDGDAIFKSTITFINFYSTAVLSFNRLGRNDLRIIFFNKINSIKGDIVFLNEDIIERMLQIPFESFDQDFIDFYSKISEFLESKLNKSCSKEILLPEHSDYTDDLFKLENVNFTLIRNLSNKYILGLDNRKRLELKNRLDSGVKIIDDTELLYAYFYSYGKMHSSKVEDATKKISKQIENKTIEIYDWGCGQALASMVFLESIEKLKINIDVKKITLIEPSEIALKRGMAHINCIYPKVKNDFIRPICKDLNSITVSDFMISSNIKFHLFSNILDVPYFDLNKLCNRISSLKGLNIFICVSPVLKEVGRSIRLPKFLEFFENNFETKILSKTINTKIKNKWKSNNCPCPNHNNEFHYCEGAWTRHEIIFTSIIK